MLKIDFKKQVLPHLLVLLTFLVVLVVYFSPAFFKNQEIVQSDILQWRGGAEEIIKYREETGKQPLWTNSMFGGMPSYFVSTVYEGNLIPYVQKVIQFGFPSPAFQVLLTLISGYIFFLMFGLRPVIAAIGSFAYAFSTFSFISLEAGHNGKVLAMAYIPWVVGGIYYAYRKNKLIGALVFGLGLAMSLLTNHLQITYYLVIIVVGFGIAQLYLAIKNKEIADFAKTTVLLVVVAALAAATNMGALLTTFEYGKYSIRGKSELQPAKGEVASEGLDRDYAFEWSNTPDESFTILVPNYYGGSSNGPLGEKSATFKAVEQKADRATAKNFTQQVPLYFGQLAFTSGPVYFGAIICFLFVLGLFVVEGEIKYWLLGATILSFFLSWGKHFGIFNYLLFDYLPGYNKFRAVSMGVVIAQFCMPALGILALDRVLKTQDWAAQKKKILYAVGFTAGLALIIALFAGGRSYATASDDMLRQQAGQWLVDSIHADRESMVRTDAVRSIFLILLVAGALFAVAMKRIGTEVAMAIIAFLVVFDLWSVDKRYLNDSNFRRKAKEEFFAITPADEMIHQDKALSYRVFNIQNPFNDARTSYFHKSIGGYSAAKLRRYQELIERQISKNNINVLNMLNTKYVMTGDERQPVQILPGALGNAWFVQNVKTVNSPDEEINALSDSAFNPATIAIVDASKFKTKQTNYDMEAATIVLTDYKPDYLKYESNSTKDGLAVFSEIYYPEGWNVTIDGKPADHLRVNYVLRAMDVPAGKHIIEFSFQPTSFSTGNTIARIASILLIGGLIGAVAWTVKGKKSNPEA